MRAILACRHTPERTEEELQILVDHGVQILDVIVEHPLYGELRGPLMIESRADLQDFFDKVHETKAMLLSSLTGGVHLHTVEASREEMISRAKAKLRARGISAEVERNVGMNLGAHTRAATGGKPCFEGGRLTLENPGLCARSARDYRCAPARRSVAQTT